jgi:sulfatase maturation enzyme AslB (radical SAM superfamily)
LIIESIKNGTFINYIKTIYDKDKLESYSLWGTEPTTLIPVFIKYNFFETLLNEFPKLNTFSLSTNLIRNIHTIITFLEHIDEL